VQYRCFGKPSLTEPGAKRRTLVPTLSYTEQIHLRSPTTPNLGSFSRINARLAPEPPKLLHPCSHSPTPPRPNRICRGPGVHSRLSRAHTTDAIKKGPHWPQLSTQAGYLDTVPFPICPNRPVPSIVVPLVTNRHPSNSQFLGNKAALAYLLAPQIIPSPCSPRHTLQIEVLPASCS